MLRLFLITAPTIEHVPALVVALRPYAPVSVSAHRELAEAGAALSGALGASFGVEERLRDGSDAIALIEEYAGGGEGPLVVLASEDVARAVVVHALDAPVVGPRLAFDPGGLAEIEVRLDSPWTVSRLNEICHDTPDTSSSDGGIVRT
ncbi:MAG: hypothetical protein WEA81_03240 [Dehalococcoidia bacterium]